MILQEAGKFSPLVLKHLNTASLNKYLISEHFFKYS